MAIAAATKIGDFTAGFLPPTIAQPIFEKAARISAFQQLARQVPLGANGVAIPVVAGRMSAGWVDEAAAKPSSAAALDLKTMTPKKIAAIAVVSAEVVRANPGNYMSLLRPQIAEAFAIAFDYAAAHDVGPDGTGTGPFATHLATTSKVVEFGTATQGTGGTYRDLVAALQELVGDRDSLERRYRLTGWAFSPRVEPVLLSSVDTTGRPLFIEAPRVTETSDVNSETTSGRVLGRPAFIGEGVDFHATIGWAGDFTQAAWGVVGGINYDVSTEASVTIGGSLVSLFENNLVAIRAEAEYGWLVNDDEAFVELTDVETS